MAHRHLDSTFPQHYHPEHREAVQIIEAALNELEVTYADLSRVSGVPTGTVSQVLRGKYPSMPANPIGKMMEGIDRIRDRQSAAGEFPFVETSVFKTFSMVVEEALRMRTNDFIGLCCGYVGVGKSWAIKEICRRNPNVIYLRASVGMSKSDLLIRLLEIIKVDPRTAGTISAKQSAVVRLLRAREKCIILDEATRCSRTVLECLRDIADEAEIALVFAGREQLFDKFSANTGDYAEISSRILTRIAPIRALAREDVDLIIRSVFKDISDENLDMIYQCSQSNARELRKLMIKLDNFQRNKGELTPEIISHIYTGHIEVKNPNWCQQS